MRRVRLVLGLVTFGRSNDQATQPSHPSVDRCNEYWRGKKRRVLSSLAVGHVTRTAGVLTYCMLANWVYPLLGQRAKGMSSLATDLMVHA